MNHSRWFAVIVAFALSPTLGRAESLAKVIKKAVERSTLDQPGTEPFHLRAELAPSFERDKQSGRTVVVEIWWASPTRWRKEIQSPDFHQIAVVDGERRWQKTDGTYYPQWLEQTATELIRPVPPLPQVLEGAQQAEIKRMGQMTSLSWTTPSGTPEVRNGLISYLALQNTTGLLLYAGGMGWGAEFKDYANFRGRMVARTINVGSPQITTKVTILEELGTMPPAFFDATRSDGDTYPVQTS